MYLCGSIANLLFQPSVSEIILMC